MLTLFGSFIGFLGSIVPELFRNFQDKSDKAHELKILELQMQQQANQSVERMQAININADISEASALYKTFYSGNSKADFFNGMVRPTIAMGFFILYSALKIIAYTSIPQLQNAPFTTIYQTLWSEEDAAIFAGIISFYFGSRALSKQRNAR